MRDIHRHKDPEDLERYSTGLSSLEEIALIEEHLLTCEGCQDRLRETDDYLLAVRMALEQCRRDERSAKGHEWRFPAWFPALAAEPAAGGGHAPLRPAARAGGGGGFSDRAPEHWSRRKQRPGQAGNSCLIYFSPGYPWLQPWGGKENRPSRATAFCLVLRPV